MQYVRQGHREAPGHRRWRPLVLVLLAVGLVGAGVGSALAGTSGSPAGEQGAAGGAEPGDAADGGVVCPSVEEQLPAVPAQARAEVDRNLRLLQTQIAEADRRLVTSRGQGGPNFVSNAILGPLADKRAATLDRIAIAIGRRADRPEGLEAFAECSLGVTQPAPGGDAAAPGPGDAAAPGPGDAAASEPGDGAEGGSGDAAGDGGAAGGAGSAGAGAVVCPSVVERLPAVPAQAQAEVNRNLRLLQTQIAEANRRLVTTRGQGGPNFVSNAILGPLADKRAATLDRIATAIGRDADRPDGLRDLAPCTT